MAPIPPYPTTDPSPEPRSVPRPRPLAWHVVWAMPIVPIALFFMFTIQAEAGPNNYTRTYTLGEAIAETWAVPLSHLFLQPFFYLLPYAIIIHVLGSLALRRRLGTYGYLFLALGRLVLSTGLPFTLPGVVFAPIQLTLMIAGTDGETYSEGLLRVSAIGLWAIYQIAIAWRDTWNREFVRDECVRCQYARDGLAPESPCPECGLVPSTIH